MKRVDGILYYRSLFERGMIKREHYLITLGFVDAGVRFREPSHEKYACGRIGSPHIDVRFPHLNIVPNWSQLFPTWFPSVF